jgi:hypothetical protein
MVNPHIPSITKDELLNWVKTHRFWTSIIILWYLHLILLTSPFYSLHRNYPIVFAILSYSLGIYFLTGGIIWSVQTKKKGMLLVTLGIFSLLISSKLLLIFLDNLISGHIFNYSLINYLLLGLTIIIGVVFIYFGDKHNKQQELHQGAKSRNKNLRR